MRRIPDYFKESWHLVALSKDVKIGCAIAREVIGMPIAIFRTREGIGALIDRCPHRNYPLSEGRVVNNSIECPYHGWRFGLNGQCENVPGCSLNDTNSDRLKAQMVRIKEKHGGVFVCLSTEGPDEPDLPPLMGDKNLDHFWWKQGTWVGSSFDAIENVMDPFHTNFIHHGFIRRHDQRLPVKLQVNCFERSIEMVIEQTRPDYGIMSRALEHGGRAQSRTRYYPPTTVQACWEGKEKLTLCVTAFFTPVNENSFSPFACFTTPKGAAPAWLKEMLIRLFLAPVIEQDKKALERQYEVIKHFNAPRYTQGPGDILGNRIHKLYTNETLSVGSEEKYEVTL